MLCTYLIIYIYSYITLQPSSCVPAICIILISHLGKPSVSSIGGWIFPGHESRKRTPQKTIGRLDLFLHLKVAELPVFVKKTLPLQWFLKLLLQKDCCFNGFGAETMRKQRFSLNGLCFELCLGWCMWWCKSSLFFSMCSLQPKCLCPVTNSCHFLNMFALLAFPLKKTFLEKKHSSDVNGIISASNIASACIFFCYLKLLHQKLRKGNLCTS